MNSMLPSITWGTWDHLDSIEHLIKIESENITSTVDDKLSRGELRRQRKGLRVKRKDDQWFVEILKRLRSIQSKNYPLYYCNPLNCNHKQNRSFSIPWEEFETGLHPRDGKLNVSRTRRKQWQVENIAAILLQILRPGDIVVEFCAGSGYVALPVAYLFPECEFVILDKKEMSLEIAKERIRKSRIKNVRIFQGLVSEFNEPFDVGIALHACGEATDMVHTQCITNQASYVLAPCCVGKIKHSIETTYPRSDNYRSNLSLSEYEVLARAADFGHFENELCKTELNQKRRCCKSFVEYDRNLSAEEVGYHTQLFIMYPVNATPKNDILVGLSSKKFNQQQVQEYIRSLHPLENIEVEKILYNISEYQ